MRNNAHYLEGSLGGIHGVVIVSHDALQLSTKAKFDSLHRTHEVRHMALKPLLDRLEEMTLKYIVGTLSGSPFEMAVVFPDWINHTTMADLFTGRLIGAGFVTFKNQQALPYSSSFSLRLGPNPTDHAVLRWILGDAFWKRGVSHG